MTRSAMRVFGLFTDIGRLASVYRGVLQEGQDIICIKATWGDMIIKNDVIGV